MSHRTALARGRQRLGVGPTCLEASLGEMYAVYGTVEQYFTDGLRVDALTQSTP